jgi:uncharacterized membrane protein YhfC
MVYFSLGLNVALMLVMPFAVARLIVVKRGASWGLFGIGAVTFLLSQLGHLPFNWLVQQRLKLIPSDVTIFSNLVIIALFLGLSAGTFEEVARYVAYRHWAKGARSWGQGLMLGAGHGGIEAIIVGLLVGINTFVLARMRSGALMQLVPEGQLPMVEAQIEALFSAEWYTILLGAAERMFAICLHLSASLLVMQSLVTGRRRWLLGAILWHALLDALAVFAVVQWGIYVTEALVGAMAIVSLVIVFWLRAPEPQTSEIEPLPSLEPSVPLELELTADKLEKSRYV